MKPNFALSFSFDGIRLLHRVASGWHLAGEVALDAADLDDQLAMLRRTALALDPSGLRTKLLIPNEQIRYLVLDSAHATEADIEAALDGATPYEVHELVHDHVRGGGRTYVAAVARETLFEAEEFAVEHRFAPLAFAAVPLPHTFIGEAFFGPTRAAARLLPAGAAVERDEVAVTVIGHAHLPKAGEGAPAPGKAAQDPGPGVAASGPEARAPTADAPASGAAAGVASGALAADAATRTQTGDAPTGQAAPEVAPPGARHAPAADRGIAAGAAPRQDPEAQQQSGAAGAASESPGARPSGERPAPAQAPARPAAPQAPGAVPGGPTDAPAGRPSDRLHDRPSDRSHDRPHDRPFDRSGDSPAEAPAAVAARQPRPAVLAEDARPWRTEAPLAGAFAGASAAPAPAFAGARAERGTGAGRATAGAHDLPQPDLAMAASVAATLAPYDERGTGTPGERTARLPEAEGVTLSAPLAARLNAGSRAAAQEDAEPFVASPLFAGAPASGTAKAASTGPGQAAGKAGGRLAFDERMERLQAAQRSRRRAPRLLALILTALLLLALAGVSAWAALWTEEGLAGLFGRDRAAPAAVAQAVPEAADPAAAAAAVAADDPAEGILAPAGREVSAPVPAPAQPSLSASAEAMAASTGRGIALAGRGAAALDAAPARVPPVAPGAHGATEPAPAAPGDGDPAALADGGGQETAGAEATGPRAAAVDATRLDPAARAATDLAPTGLDPAAGLAPVAGLAAPAPAEPEATATGPAAAPGPEAAALEAAVDLVAAAMAAERGAAEGAAPAAGDPAPEAPPALATAAAPPASETAPQPAASPARAPAVATRGTVLPPAEAERRHAATGVWQRAPRLPLLPRTETLGDLRLAAAEPVTARPLAALLQNAAVPPDLPALPDPDAGPLRQADPPPAGAVFERDAQGLVAATEEGAATPQGITVFAGAPDVRPPARPGSGSGTGSGTGTGTDTGTGGDPAPEGTADSPPAEGSATAAAGEGTATAGDAPAAAGDGATAGGVTLAALRPALRPAALPGTAEPAPDAGPVPAALQPQPELAGSRPRARPAEAASAAALGPDIAAALAEATEPVIENATARAVPASPRPDARPQNFATAVAQGIVRSATPGAASGAPSNAGETRPAQAASLAVTTRPAPQAATPAPAPPSIVAPSGPIPGGVATAATQERAINLRDVNLIGVYGSPNARRALVRLGNGRYVKVGVGDSLDGGQVSAIGDNVINYVKRGRTIALAIPSG